jgi:hypothetical protein
MAQRLADHLRRQGSTVADIRPVDFDIGSPSVPYFFARDWAASERLVEELGRFSEGHPWRRSRQRLHPFPAEAAPRQRRVLAAGLVRRRAMVETDALPDWGSGDRAF